MQQISLTINDKKITAPKGEYLLRAALNNDIYIPNLCAIEGKSEPTAG